MKDTAAHTSIPDISVFVFLTVYEWQDNLGAISNPSKYIWIIHSPIFFQQNVQRGSRFRNSDFYLKYPRIHKIITDVDFHSQDMYPTILTKMQYEHHM